ncbi:ABC transporter substrate-binding protein [Collinsella vaginalis]|uniref:ABC transporter substrate-binding protein n=1 Tax=Collinsella vaginalis TaxID=1870987 RepID=UPI001C4EA251|nr:ABC transporter substrate-binding protein [Collinsella vaginalis]
MSHQMMSRRAFALSALAGAAALTGCTANQAASSGSTAGSGSSSSDLKKITFALDWTPNTNHTGLYVAQERGYFKDAGFDVTILQAPENGADSLVATGEAQFGVSFQDSMASYLTGDSVLPVSAIAAIIQHNTSGIISLADKGITSPAKMMDHTYATWEMPIEQGVIKRCVEADGGDYSRVKMVPETITDEVSALSSNQVDSIWIFWAWAGEKCKLAGLDVNYFAFADIDSVFDYYTPVIIANDDLIKNDPDTVQAFMDATRKGYEDCIKDPDGTADILLKAAPELDRDLVVASQRYLADQYQADASAWGLIDQNRWDAFYSWIAEQGFVPELASGAGLSTDFIKA